MFCDSRHSESRPSKQTSPVLTSWSPVSNESAKKTLTPPPGTEHAERIVCLHSFSGLFANLFLRATSREIQVMLMFQDWLFQGLILRSFGYLLPCQTCYCFPSTFSSDQCRHILAILLLLLNCHIFNHSIYQVSHQKPEVMLKKCVQLYSCCAV